MSIYSCSGTACIMLYLNNKFLDEIEVDATYEYFEASNPNSAMREIIDYISDIFAKHNKEYLKLKEDEGADDFISFEVLFRNDFELEDTTDPWETRTIDLEEIDIFN